MRGKHGWTMGHCHQTFMGTATILESTMLTPSLATQFPASLPPLHFVRFLVPRTVCTLMAWARSRPIGTSFSIATILARIIQTSYAVRLTESSTRARRREEAAELENALDRWHLDLPAHLRVEIRYESTTPTGDNGRVVVCSSDESKAPGSSGVPPPHVLALHMQYWCTVLLLHRPL